ncbi:MAG TPA: GDP-mannose 4,6-dehydratase [Gaiellaceae bacterium]|nr:GDP-mannose 4,6-dehydratase [Gaiellaceae bacterium]
MRALVTGAGGFVGQWLCRDLLRRGWVVTGATLDGAPDAARSILSAEERGAVRWTTADVSRAEGVRAALDSADRPDAVFHLAGVSFVPGAGSDPGLTCETNVVAAARLLGEVRVRRRAGALDPVVLVVGSAEQYGRHDAAELPLGETAEQRPLTVYAASKAAQEVFAMEAFRSEGVRVVATRSFNHSGAGQAPHFLMPALVRRALALRAAAARGDAGGLLIGNRDTVRDFLHVRDVVRAYILLVERGLPGEAYNVSSGVGHRVDALAAQALAALGVSAELTTDPALARPVEVPALVGDSTKLRRATGWAPAFDTSEIIHDLIHAATQ